MPATTTHGYPYPLPTDPPDGAAQVKALAEAIDTKAVRADDLKWGSSVVTIASNGATVPIPGGMKLHTVSNGDPAATTAVPYVLPSEGPARIYTPSLASGSFRVNWLAVPTF